MSTPPHRSWHPHAGWAARRPPRPSPPSPPPPRRQATALVWILGAAALFLACSVGTCVLVKRVEIPTRSAPERPKLATNQSGLHVS
jgi:hypothetical protein